MSESHENCPQHDPIFFLKSLLKQENSWYRPINTSFELYDSRVVHRDIEICKSYKQFSSEN